MHFAGLKAVGESVLDPMSYYQNNCVGSINLLELMKEFDVKKIIYSSSATVYGDPGNVKIEETFPCKRNNPYGNTKFFVESILKDLENTESGWSIITLRYFNPAGAHPSGMIGEDPKGIPNNLLPFCAQVAIGKLERVKIFGNDYETADGTGIRDYIHVEDLAEGHVYALKHILRSNRMYETYNLGTGTGYSVLEIVTAMRNATGQVIPTEYDSRRSGDVAFLLASPMKAEKMLGWKATKGLEEMCRDLWNWQSKNPNGFE